MLEKACLMKKQKTQIKRVTSRKTMFLLVTYLYSILVLLLRKNHSLNAAYCAKSVSRINIYTSYSPCTLLAILII